jgi:DNA-binding NarL/FixJ family response regulator
MRAARILIADEHEIARIGVKSILKPCESYEICGEAANGRAAVEQTHRLKPDLVILDVSLPFLNGLEAARQILSQCPQTSVLIFTEIDSERAMRQALHAGIGGFVLKSDPACDLLTAAEAMLQGRTFFTSLMTRMLLDLARKHSRESLISAREREVIQLISEGHCSKEIAQILTLSLKTVETHRCNVMRKLKFNSTANLILYAIRNEIVHVPNITPWPRARHRRAVRARAFIPFPRQTSETSINLSAEQWEV